MPSNDTEEMVFTTFVQRLRRIAIPKVICKALDIEPGDYVECRIKRVKKGAERILRK